MTEIDDIVDFESTEENEESEEEYEEEATETSDVSSSVRPSSDYNVESAATVSSFQSPQLAQTSQRVSAMKRRYTRRISLFEITGIIAESFNLLQRGRLPLVKNISNETFKEKILHIVVREIQEGTCPIVIEKNGELLSINDFDGKGVRYHLDYIINIWKQQNRF